MTPLKPVEAVILGVPKRRLYAWCRDGRIKGAVKIGRRWFVDTPTTETTDDNVADMLRSLGYPIPQTKKETT